MIEYINNEMNNQINIKTIYDDLLYLIQKSNIVDNQQEHLNIILSNETIFQYISNDYKKIFNIITNSNLSHNLSNKLEGIFLTHLLDMCNNNNSKNKIRNHLIYMYAHHCNINHFINITKNKHINSKIN